MVNVYSRIFIRAAVGFGSGIGNPVSFPTWRDIPKTAGLPPDRRPQDRVIRGKLIKLVRDNVLALVLNIELN